MEPDEDSGDLSLVEECGSHSKLSRGYLVKKKGRVTTRPGHVFVMGTAASPNMSISWFENSVFCNIFHIVVLKTGI